MIQITKATEYGIRLIFELSLRNALQEPVSLQEISEKQEIPVTYVRKLVLLLINANLIRSYRGSKGGVALARAPEEISMYDVMEATEGGVALNTCLMGNDECGRQQMCPVHYVWKRTQELMIGELQQANFKDLAAVGEAVPRRARNTV
jgi:Rrf2 family protein